MAPNPYQPPLAELGPHEPSSIQQRFSVAEGRLQFAVLAVTALVIAGVFIGVLGGILVLSLVPRDVLASMPAAYRPACGNDIIDPIALAGAAVGFISGLSLSWRKICSEPSRVMPTD